MSDDIVFMQTNEIPPDMNVLLRLCFHACSNLVTIFRSISMSLLENELVETNSYTVISE